MKKELMFLTVEIVIYLAIYDIFRSNREILEKLDLLILDRQFEKDKKDKDIKEDRFTVPRVESSRSD